MRSARQFAAAAFLLAPAVASAGPCAGASPFTDVSAAAGYCTETEWLKNRNVTLGCGGAHFCPNDFVTRGAMALFLRRLGDALNERPLSRHRTISSAFTLTSVNIKMCEINVTAVNYPRFFAVTGHVSAVGGSATNTIVQMGLGVDHFPGGSGVFLNDHVMTIDSSWRSSISSSVVRFVPAGVAAQFWIGLSSGNGSSNAVGGAICTLLAQGRSGQDAISSPFDEPEMAAPTN